MVQRADQNIARIAFKRRMIRTIYIADQSRNAVFFRRPGIDDKGIQIRIQTHIRFLNAHKALDGGAVKHTVVFQRFFQLLVGDRHVFQRTQNVCKLQTDKTHVVFAYHLHDLFFGILCHRCLLKIFRWDSI